MLGMMVKLLILVERVDDTDKSGNNDDDYDVDDNNKDFDTRTLIVFFRLQKLEVL